MTVCISTVTQEKHVNRTAAVQIHKNSFRYASSFICFSEQYSVFIFHIPVTFM